MTKEFTVGLLQSIQYSNHKTIMLGRVLASRYRIVQALAQGGFGKAFLAEDTLLPGVPHCVVKQLTVGQGNANALGIARRLFNQEAIMLQKLGVHSQIPQLFAYFEEDNDFFLVQELIEGISIKEEFHQKKRLLELQCIELLRDCLGTLAFVHSLGVIHRDIKPANLMRRQLDGQIVLLDFGAVKEIEMDQSQLADTTVSIGTHGYMPDEQLRGKPQFASDIYALGMTCLQGLTATHPRNFERDDYDEISWQKLVSVHPALEQLLSTMVRRDPRHRYAQAKAVLADLEHHFGPAAATSPAKQVTPHIPPLQEAKASAAISTPPNINPSGVSIPVSPPPEQTNTQNGSATYNSQALDLSQSQLDASDASTLVSTQEDQQTTSNDSTIFSLQSGNGTIGTSSSPIYPDPASTPSHDSSTYELSEQAQEQPHVLGVSTARQPLGSSSTAKTVPELNLLPDTPDRLAKTGRNSLGKPFRFLKWIVPSMLLLLAGTGIGMFLLRQPSATAQVLEQLESLYTQKKFTDCFRLGEAAISDPDIPESSIREPLAQCYLGAAKVQADQGHYADALKIVTKVSSNSTHYNQAKQNINDWSTQLLSQAKTTYAEKGQLQKALALTGSIPKSSSVHDEAAKLSKQWQEDHKTNESLVKEAQVALDEKRSETAIAKAEQVKQPQFWKQKAETIITAAKKEIANRPVIATPVPATTARQPAPASTTTTSSWQPTPSSPPALTPTRRPAPAAPAASPVPRAWPTPSPAPRAW